LAEGVATGMLLGDVVEEGCEVEMAVGLAEGLAIGVEEGCDVEMAVGLPEGRKLGLGIGIGVGPEIGMELGTERENPDGLVHDTVIGTH